MKETDFTLIDQSLISLDQMLRIPDMKTAPEREDVIYFLKTAIASLFPCLADRGKTDISAKQLYLLLAPILSRLGISDSDSLSLDIISELPAVKEMLIKDAIAIYNGDPAAVSPVEVISCYPGFLAITVQRIAHLLYVRNIPIIPRIMTEYAHSKTGIDIHPGARIGESFCIDHGTGVVIGETAVIGNNVKIYQGVTVGAKSFEKDELGRPIKGKKRHPTIGNNCIIYAGATILGGDTLIGDGCVIGGNVWLTHSLPAGARVYFENKK